MEDNQNKRNFFSGLGFKDLLFIGGLLASVLVTYSKMQDHLSDDAIHINPENERALLNSETVLTQVQKYNLIRLLQSFNDEFPNIDKNHNDIEEIEKWISAHQKEFHYLYTEHEDLESKLSREIKSLNETFRLILKQQE